MKKIFSILALFLTITSCNNDEEIVPDLSNRTALNGGVIRGAAGLYWDLSTGIPRTDLPGFMPPSVRQAGGSFLHRDWPSLSFEYPAGYRAVEIRGPQTAGVDLIRQDNQVIWRWLTTTTNGFPSARQLRQQEVGRMLQFYGLNNNNLELVDLDEKEAVLAPGIVARRSISMVRSGQITALVSAEVTHVQGLPTSSVTYRISSGPTDEYDQLVFDTFLAIEFQMLYASGGGMIDSDGDGVADPYDREPNNPNVQ